MGKEFVVNTLEEMCDLMCNNVVPKEHKYKAAWIANPAGGCEWGFHCTYCGVEVYGKLPDKCPKCGLDMRPPKTFYKVEDYSKVSPYVYMCDKALQIKIDTLYQLPYKIYDPQITEKHHIFPLCDSFNPFAQMDVRVMIPEHDWEINTYNGYLEIVGDIDGYTDMRFVIGVEK